VLAAIERVLPACKEEVRRRLPELEGKAFEAEAFRVALRQLRYSLSRETYRYIQWRFLQDRLPPPPGEGGSKQRARA